MAVWDLDTVRKVSALRVRLYVGFQGRMPPPEHIVGEMFKKLRKAAQDLLVDIDIADVDRKVDERGDVWHLRWAPSTKTARFLGGPNAGQVLVLRDLDLPFKVEVYNPPDWTGDPADPLGEISTSTVIYRRTGWDDQQRVWVFEPTP